MGEAPTISELARLSRALGRIYALGDIEAFAQNVLGELPRVIPSELTSLCVMDPSRQRSVNRVVPREVGLDPEAHETWLRYMNDCPTVAYAARTGDGRAKRLSEFWSQRQFLDTGIYADHYRPKQVDRMMAGHLCVAGTVIGFGVHRRGSDFTERERELLDIMRPHLAQAHANAAAFAALSARVGSLGDAVTTLSAATVTLDGARRILSADRLAVDWIAEHFAEWPTHAQHLPGALDRWVAEELRARTGPEGRVIARRPLVLGSGERHVVVRLVPSEGAVTLILQHRTRDMELPALRGLGLSEREAEVLRGAARGETNAEIARALGISELTVKKHLENMYAKLSVGNRTALVSLAWQAAESAAV